MTVTYKVNMERTWDNPLALLFPAFLAMLRDDGTTIFKEVLSVYVITPLG